MWFFYAGVCCMKFLMGSRKQGRKCSSEQKINLWSWTVLEDVYTRQILELRSLISSSTCFNTFYDELELNEANAIYCS